MNNDAPESLPDEQSEEALSTDSAERRRAFKLRRLSHEPLRVQDTIHGIVDIHGSPQASLPTDISPSVESTVNAARPIAESPIGTTSFPLPHFPLPLLDAPLSGESATPPSELVTDPSLPIADTSEPLSAAPLAASPSMLASPSVVEGSDLEKSEFEQMRLAKRRIRSKRLIYSGVALLLLAAVAGALIITTYPNVAIKYVVKPRLQDWVHEKFGDGYTFEMHDVTLSPNKDSLIITGVKLAENGKVVAPKPGEFAQPNALEQFSIDTIKIAAFDYWKLLSQDGLFAGSITLHSPKIFLRPGVLPNFETNNHLFSKYLPIISTKSIKIDNAEVFFADAPVAGEVVESRAVGSAPRANGVVIKHASIELRDFFVDEPSFQKGTRTFFSKSAAFDAQDISHLNRNGKIDASVVAVNGNLIDSTLHVTNVQMNDPLKEVRRVVVDNVEFTGLDWNALMAQAGMHVTRLTISSPRLFMQPGAAAPTIKLTDNLPLPKVLPSVTVQTLAVSNGEIYDLLPRSREINALKRLSLVLHNFAIDASTPISNVGSFFSHSANFAIKGVTSLTTPAGSIRMSDIKGTDKSAQATNIRLQPAQKGVRLVSLKSASVSGINWTKLLMRKGFFSGSVILKQPDIYLDAPTGDQAAALPKTAPNEDPLAILKTVIKYPLPDMVPVIAAGTISVTDGKLHGVHLFDGPADPNNPGDSVAGLKLSLKNFRLDRASFLAKRGMLFSAGGTFAVGPITHYTPGDIYSYTEGGVSGNVGTHMLRIDSLLLHPVISEDSFGTLYKYRTNRYDAFAPQIVLNGFDFDRLLTGKGIFADSVFVHGFKIALFADKRLESAPRVGPEVFPQEAFQQIKTIVGFKSVVVDNGDLAFSERWPSGSESGKITMDNINASIGPISNDPRITTPTTPTVITGDMRIMGAGFFTYTIDYQLMNPKLAIEARGRVDSMNASVFNDYLIHAEPFKLTGGIIQSAEFQLSIEDSVMKGMMLPLYDNLRVEFFRYDGFPPGLFSLLANYIYMRSHNSVEKDHPPMTAQITGVISRDDNFFWSMWLPVRKAVSSVVGIPGWVW